MDFIIIKLNVHKIKLVFNILKWLLYTKKYRTVNELEWNI